MYDEKVRSVKPSKEKAYSLKKVIKDCIDNGILKDFLTLHHKEVEDMMMTVIPPEQALEYIKLEEYNKGIEQGKLDTSLNFARNMLKNNYSIDSIIEITGLSREQIERLLPLTKLMWVPAKENRTWAYIEGNFKKIISFDRVKG